MNVTVESTDANAENDQISLESEKVETPEVEASEEKQEESTTSEDVKPKKNTAKRRINELTKEKYEALQRQQELEAEVERLRGQTVIQQDAPPRLEEFQDEASYYEAVNNWNKEQIAKTEKERQAQAEQAQIQQEQIKKQVALQQKMVEAQEKYPDFLLKINNPELPPLEQLSPAAFEAVIESDSFADVANYLASNPDELYAFGSMSPVQAVKEVAKLEIKLSGTPKPQSNISPPSEVGGKASAAKSPADMTTEEFFQWRREAQR
jgi:chromosome segregation ATPase